MNDDIQKRKKAIDDMIAGYSVSVPDQISGKWFPAKTNKKYRWAFRIIVLIVIANALFTAVTSIYLLIFNF